MSNISEQLNPIKWNLVKKDREFGSNKIFLAKQIQKLPTNDFFPQQYISPTGVYSNLVNEIKTTNLLEDADYVLVPHDWVMISKDRTYIKYLEELSRNNPLIILNTGDISPKVKISNTLEIRTFIHPWENLIRKIIIPYPAKPKPFKIRKWSSVPTISFMGYVPKFSLGSLTGKHINFISHPIKSSVFINRKFGTYRLNRLGDCVYTNSVKRENFTAYSKNPNLSTEVLEYEESLMNSDYVLCPRGFGNTSIRFYECLSAGRTPIIIESNGGLPLVNREFAWSEQILNVGIFSNWRAKILQDWELLQISNEYENRQNQNHRLFTTNLELNSYLLLLFKYFLK
jgi:hypothetical protein